MSLGTPAQAGLVGHAAASYRKTRTQTAGGPRLLVEVYDAAIACLLAPDPHAHNGSALLRAHTLISELQATLVPEHDSGLARELSEFYDAALNRIVTAYVRDEASGLVGVATALRELRAAWNTLSEQPAKPARRIPGSPARVL